VYVHLAIPLMKVALPPLSQDQADRIAVILAPWHVRKLAEEQSGQ
jgi:hypothetical protein